MTQLTKTETDLVVLSRQDDIVLLRQRDGGMAHGLVLTRVKVGGAGAIQYQDEFGAMHPKLSGVIIVSRMTRVFYILSFDDTGGGEEPDCVSYDMEHGSVAYNGEFGGDCANCPMNEWGTAKGGRGKRCREGRTLAIASREVGPCLLRLPPSSIKPTDQYEGYLEVSGLHYGVVESELSLARVEKKGVPAFSQARFQMLRELSDAERARVVNEQLAWIEYLESFTQRDVESADAEPTDEVV